MIDEDRRAVNVALLLFLIYLRVLDVVQAEKLCHAGFALQLQAEAEKLSLLHKHPPSQVLTEEGREGSRLVGIAASRTVALQHS